MLLSSMTGGIPATVLNFDAVAVVAGFVVGLVESLAAVVAEPTGGWLVPPLSLQAAAASASVQTTRSRRRERDTGGASASGRGVREKLVGSRPPLALSDRLSSFGMRVQVRYRSGGGSARGIAHRRDCRHRPRSVCRDDSVRH